MFRPRLIGACAVAVLTCALTGCGGADAPAPPAPSTPAPAPAPQAAPEATAWAEHACQAFFAQTAPLSTLPTSSGPEPAQVKQGMLTYLNGLSTAFGSITGQFDQAGPPPVPGGSELVGKTQTILRDTKQAVDTAIGKVSEAPVGEQQKFQATIDAVGGEIGTLRAMDDPMRDLKAHPELKPAYAEAPTCRRLNGA
ncbi:hypothetical protein [Amycolatopsis nigrescens]|uniref:hypothetical protein n=1 Tax=Amycolatopsis nigrescens TaxID=381445 RepID=UPI000378C5FB|nr:hypothetical protein [Amycolatopsis nigrescens]